jgi:RES domain
VLLYRVFPHLAAAVNDEPGGALYVHPHQGTGRWDNPHLYRAMYVAAEPAGAIGESFAHLSTWSPAMLDVGFLAGAHRVLATYELDEDIHPLLDFDDARALLDRRLRPSDIVIRNRPRTQQIAADVFAEGQWAGLSWWSMHRPQWTLHVLWTYAGLVLRRVEQLPDHPGLLDAASRLGKLVDPSMDSP